MIWSLALSALAMDVNVEENVARDQWTVTWQTEQPVRGLLFSRNRNPVQADFKRNGGKLVELDDHLVWLAPKGKPRAAWTATFDTNTDYQQKDYELNVAFGDGARLLYTDHLFAVPVVCPGGAASCANEELETLEAQAHAFEFETDGERFVLTPDGRSQGNATWTQRSGGVYIYFGNGEVLPDERVNFMLDPTLPSWVVDRTDEWLGPLFDHYIAQTGRELSFRPVVLLSYRRGDPGQQSYGGGGLPGQMQMQLEGQSWLEETAENREKYVRFLAHELFHMWNSQEVSTNVDSSEEWLSEGGADLFSLWSLGALGVLDEPAIQSRIRDAASQCAAQLRSAPLLTAHKRGNYRAFYTCGSVGLFLLHTRLEAFGGLPAVYREMFAEGNEYNTYDLLETAHRNSGDPLVAAPLEALLRSGLGPDPIGSLARQLEGAGLPTATADAWTVSTVGQKVLHGALVQTAGDCDCGGSVSVWNHGDMLKFGALEQCDALREGFEVTEIAGGPVLPTREALQRAWAEIDAGATLTLAGATGTRTLTCEDVSRPQALIPGGDER